MKMMPDCSTRSSCRAADRIHVGQPGQLLGRQVLERLGHQQLPPLGPALEQARHHVLDVDADFFDVSAADDLEGGSARVTHLDLDGAVIEPTRSQLLRSRSRVLWAGSGRPDTAGSTSGRGPGGRQQVEQAIFGCLPGLRPQLFEALVAHHRNRQLHQVADHRLDVAADVADLGELRGFDLDEGRLGQTRQPARDLGLAHPGGPDHQDVLRATSSARSLGSFWRRVRLRSAIATARLALCWPITCCRARRRSGAASSLQSSSASVPAGESPRLATAPRRRSGGWCRCRCRRQWPSTARRFARG
jgi:hypothetical protein